MLLPFTLGESKLQTRSVLIKQAFPQPGLDRLHLYNTHTAGQIDVVYRHDRLYVPSARAKLDDFLRDHRTDEIRHFDPQLYDILPDLIASIGTC